MIDVQKLMEQAQKMKGQMEQKQQEISQQKFEGQSGGGLVSITIDGSKEMHKVFIDQSLMQEKAMLEDLIVAAYNDAKRKAEKESKSSLSDALGDLIPSM